VDVINQEMLMEFTQIPEISWE